MINSWRYPTLHLYYLYDTHCIQLVSVVRLSATGQWFSAGTPASSTNKNDRHDVTEMLLKMALNTVTLTHKVYMIDWLILKVMDKFFEIPESYWEKFLNIDEENLYPNTYNTPQTPDGRTGIAFILIFIFSDIVVIFLSGKMG